MEVLFVYSMKVSVSLMLFYLIHRLLLRGDTFFKLRRAYFLFALFFSLLFPFCQFEFDRMGNVPEAAYMLSEIEVFVNNQFQGRGESDVQWSLFVVFVYVSMAGSTLLFSRFLVQLGGLYCHLRSKDWIAAGALKLNYLEKDMFSSFSFFHWVVVNTAGQTDRQLQDILKHESVHACQWHSIDVLLYEIFSVFFWWNPFAWLMKSEMKLNLEYLADEGALRNENSSKDYQYTLLQINMASTGMAFINNFNVSHLKKRIIMMNKKRTSMIRSSKFLMALPLAAALIVGNVLYVQGGNKADVVQQKADERIYEVVEQMPVYPGGQEAMMKYIASNLNYPAEAQEAGAAGRIIVRFTVQTDGSLADVHVIGVGNNKVADEIIAVGYKGKSSGSKLTKEQGMQLLKNSAIRVVKSMPKWTPGKQNGKAVAVYFNLPIMFRAKSDKK